MNRHRSLVCLALAFATGLTGCFPSRPFYFFEDGDLSHYKGVATEIEYPDVHTVTLDDVTQSLEPLTVRNTEAREIWDLRLEEAVQTALSNSKVVRLLGSQFVLGQNQIGGPAGLAGQPRLLQQPETVSTVYDPAIREADPNFGTEAALSAFDAQFTSQLFWELNDRPNAQQFRGFLVPVLQQDLGTFQAGVQKTAATGTTFAMRNNTSYTWNNSPANLFASYWNTNIEMEFRHPLLQGSGVDFNRIAGPNATAGNYRGVAIARVRVDEALADFEAGVRNIVSDVENYYWELYYAYRFLDAQIAGRDSALQTWRKVHALMVAGARGGEAEKEAQAREQYFLFRAQVESALSQLYAIENQLRYTMGLAATDGRLIRPADEPTTARVQFDWHEIHAESLARTVELRKQRWVIKRRELELTAAKNFLLPRLDAVGQYRWVGFGDDLINSQWQDREFDNAWQTLTSGNFQEWQAGFQLTVPIGFRQALSGVRHAQLTLARDRAILQDQELEISHQLSGAVRDLDRHYTLSQTNFNRRAAAKKQVEAVQTAYDTGTVTLDLLLEAQRRLAEAESAYYRGLTDYNRAILAVHFRKGSILDYNNVFLAEGPWPGKAYFDAHERARKRDAGWFINYGFTRPNVFSRGPVTQGAQPGIEGSAIEWDAAPTPAAGEGEVIPAPMPGAGQQSWSREAPTYRTAERPTAGAVPEPGPRLSAATPTPAGMPRRVAPGGGLPVTTSQASWATPATNRVGSTPPAVAARGSAVPAAAAAPVGPRFEYR